MTPDEMRAIADAMALLVERSTAAEETRKAHADTCAARDEALDAYLQVDPDVSGAALADLIGTSPSHVRKIRERIAEGRPAKPGRPPADADI
jgi:hypothetical protein